MARTPRASVSKTSGQGVSRLAYKVGHELGNRGSGSEFKSTLKAPSGKRDYGKLDTKGSFNVSYGDTVEPGDLKDIEAMFPARKKGR